jgi:hypothetical protein
MTSSASLSLAHAAQAIFERKQGAKTPDESRRILIGGLMDGLIVATSNDAHYQLGNSHYNTRCLIPASFWNGLDVSDWENCGTGIVPSGDYVKWSNGYAKSEKILYAFDLVSRELDFLDAPPRTDDIFGTVELIYCYSQVSIASIDVDRIVTTRSGKRYADLTRNSIAKRTGVPKAEEAEKMKAGLLVRALQKPDDFLKALTSFASDNGSAFAKLLKAEVSAGADDRELRKFAKHIYSEFGELNRNQSSN